MENYGERIDTIDFEVKKEEPDRADYITPVVAPAGEIPAKVAEKMEETQEYNLLKALFDAADYKENEEEITTIEVKRNGVFKFKFNVRPLGDDDIALARKKATKYYPDPRGKKLPKIAGETNYNHLNSWMIYLATTEEDRAKIWGNKAFMNAKNLTTPIESIDELLKAGEKSAIVDRIFEISGLGDGEGEDDDQEMKPDEYAKN